MDEAYLPIEPSLAAVQLKLDRAEEHLDALEAQVAPYNERNPYSVPDQLEAEGDWFIARLNVKEFPDRHWGLLVGEFLHNTRSALDNLVWQLVLLNEAKPWCKNQFPIYTKSATSERALRQRNTRIAEMLRGVGDDERAFIKELQPYTGGHVHRRTKVALSWLVTLSNTDKHRYLHPAFGVLDPLKVSQTAVHSTHPILEHRDSTHALLHDGAELLAVRVAPEAKVTMEGHVAFDVAFGDPRVTISFLDGIHEQVARIIERFSAAFN